MRQQSYVATSHVQWGRWGFLPRKARSCQSRRGRFCFAVARQSRSKGRRRSTLASLRPLPSPYGLETASLVAVKQSVSSSALLRILLAAFGEAVTSRRRSKAPFRLPRKRESWIQKEALLLGFTAFATASRALRALARSKKKKILRLIVLRSNLTLNL